MNATTTPLCLTGVDPIPLASSDICNPGFYCPNNTAANPPVYCPPTTECLLTRIQEYRNICPEPQGTYEPIVCRPGFYCPAGGKEQLVCPSGHYCPIGTVEPFKCMSLSRCPEGSYQERPLVGFLIIGLLDLVLIWLWLVPGLMARLKRRKMKGGLDLPVSQVEQLEPDRSDEGESEFGAVVLDGLASVGVGVEFRGVSLHKPKMNKYILAGINGGVRPGSLLGIMGQSGSGKTTLVRILVGETQATSGSIAFNGVEKDLSTGRHSSRLVGFVPQDDVVHPHLTVWENILHSARIRLGGVLSDEAIQKHAQAVIHGLGLDKVKNSVVGGPGRQIISGGERKRVSIGIEMVAEPRVLLLDEPTSGLDARAALSIIELLKRLSRQGMTIICVIHQPRVEIFEALDSLLLLESGKQAYFGEASAAQQHFQRQGYPFDPSLNPADVVMDIISGDLQPTLTGLDDSKLAQPADTEPRLQSVHSDLQAATQQLRQLEHQYKKRVAPFYKQVYYCFRRDLTQQSRQVTIFVTEVLAGVLTGLLIGVAMYELHGQIFQGMFLPPFEILSSAVSYRLVTELGLLGCFAISFAAAAPSVRVFADEGFIFYRESRSGHSEFAYFAAKFLSSLPRSFLAACHYTAFYTVLATPFAPWFMLLALNFLYFYCIYGLGSVVASLTSRENGPLVCLLATIVLAVFGGAEPRLPTVRSWHMIWLWYLCPGLWYSEAFVNEHVSPLGYLYNLEATSAQTGYTLGRTGFDIGLLVLIGTLYRGIGGALMLVRARTGWW